jgi:hypothetical protein
MRCPFVPGPRTTMTAALIALAAFANVGIAHAQILTIDDASNNLGTVDIATGTVTVIGNMGNDTMTDLAYDPSGKLFGISFGNLYRINPTTAAATLIGNTGLSGANALVFGTNGTLYLAANNDTRLFTVNTATGASTALGTTGFNSAGDLAFNNGALYMSSSTDQLIRINLSGTVSGTVVGPFGFSNVFGLATAANGVLYGVAGTQIFSTNTATGAGTAVLNYSGHGLAAANGTTFFTEAGAQVPEPGVGAILAGVAVTGAGWALRRRRTRKDLL